jgi:hypothetical protein
MASPADYAAGSQAAVKTIRAILQQDINTEIMPKIPGMFRGMVPADLADHFAKESAMAVAKAVIDAVEAERAAQAKQP